MEKYRDASSDELEEDLQASLDLNITLAADVISKAEVLVLITGAGFSADSGLAVYSDVANVKAYQDRNLEYHDICQPYWLGREPGLFYGFWGQCFNDYRMTQPHRGYEILAKWRDDKNSGPVADEMRANVEAEEKSSLLAEEGIDDPYSVEGRAGAFFTFTSNVDAHSFDYFYAHEIRECHGNVELWQCRNRNCGGEDSRGIWRVPLNHRFVVHLETMIAPRDPTSASSSGPDKEDRPRDYSDANEHDEADTRPAHVGHAMGSSRRHLLRYMIDGSGGDTTERTEENWPKCRNCGDAARPAILMFGDFNWHDNDAQEMRWENWQNALYKLARDRSEVDNPLKVAIVELGCGLNVATCRYQSEAMVMQLEEKEANVKLIRVNPDFPLVDNDDYINEENVISIMARGLDTLEKIDEARGSLE